MNELSRKLSEILALSLRPGYTAVSYAMMRGGEIFAADTLGTLGGSGSAPAGPSATFNIGSVSKIYCTTAVMQLVDRGLLDLDRPVCEYLPRFHMPDERYKKITLRHCLSHSSGLPGTMWRGFSMAGTDYYDYYSDCYDYFASCRLKAEPGEFSVYCNDGFTLAEMVVSAVSGEPFEDYSVKHITEPIGARSTRLVPNFDPEHPMVVMRGLEPEIMYIRACGGYTSTMSDLCAFGQQFLRGGEMLSDAARTEMAKVQGSSFLKKDEKRSAYGLGWDNVAFRYPGYDLGEKVLFKSGRTMQFATKFFVIPKYDAVLAMSATSDCGIDVTEVLFRLFAYAMHEELGVSVYEGSFPVPEDLKALWSGLYLLPSNVMRCRIYGADCSFTLRGRGGAEVPAYPPARYDGEKFVTAGGTVIDFEENGGDVFSLVTTDGLLIPMAQKAKARAPIPEAWKARLGKRYIVCDAGPRDLIINSRATGFVLKELDGVPGIIMVTENDRAGLSPTGLSECAVAPLDDDKAGGFVRTPTYPGRDHLFPIFELRDGTEYCRCCSYTYRDAESLPVYAGGGFGPREKENRVYRIGSRLDELPAVPAGRRLMAVSGDLVCVWDSLTSKTPFAPMDGGYLIFI